MVRTLEVRPHQLDSQLHQDGGLVVTRGLAGPAREWENQGPDLGGVQRRPEQISSDGMVLVSLGGKQMWFFSFPHLLLENIGYTVIEHSRIGKEHLFSRLSSRR